MSPLVPARRQKMEQVVSRLEPGEKFREHPAQLRRHGSLLEPGQAAYDLARIKATSPCRERSHVVPASSALAVAEGRDGLLVPTANGPEAVVWESVTLTPLEAFVAVSLLPGYSRYAPLG
jgi:hypothetical protein